MPVAHFINRCLHLPDGRDCQFLLPLKDGQDPSDFNLKGFNPGFLIPAQGTEGHVISYSYGGAQRVARKGDKKQLARDEAFWLMSKVPGLIELVDETDDGNETVSLLVERGARLSLDLDAARARAEVAEAKLRSLQNAAPTSELQLQKLTHERETALADSVRAAQENDLLKRENAGLRDTENGMLRVRFNGQNTRIAVLEGLLTDAQKRSAETALADLGPHSGAVLEDPSVAALRARADSPAPPDASAADLHAAEIARQVAAAKATPQRQEAPKTRR